MVPIGGLDFHSHGYITIRLRTQRREVRYVPINVLEDDVDSVVVCWTSAILIVPFC
jgi:hypothetical protein